MRRERLGRIWSRRDRTIPIPGFKSLEQVEENAGACNSDHSPRTRCEDRLSLGRQALTSAPQEDPHGNSIDRTKR
jgi:aryl-alcohol dehydrogenase-like predicted oxidoreductase